MKLPAYSLVMEQSQQLAKNLGVELPAELKMQLGKPAERFDQIMFGVAVLMKQASERLKPKKKSSRFKGKANH